MQFYNTISGREFFWYAVSLLNHSYVEFFFLLKRFSILT